MSCSICFPQECHVFYHPESMARSEREQQARDDQHKFEQLQKELQEIKQLLKEANEARSRS